MAFRKIYSTRNVFNNLIKSPAISGFRQISFSNKLQDKAMATSLPEVKPEWDRALTEAEKVVGLQASFISLRYLLNDADTNWTDHMKKIEDSNHPMIETTKTLFLQGHNNINQTWALVVLLIAKMAGYQRGTPEKDIDKSIGILKTQKTMADVLEMTISANDIHRTGVLNMQHFQYAGINLPFDSSLIHGNKIAILGGDILMGYASTEMGKLKDHDVNELLCTAARDVAESHFVGDRDIQNNPLPSDPYKKAEEQLNNPHDPNELPVDQIDNQKPFSTRDIMGSAESEWNLRHTLNGGTLLGKSCQATIMLARHTVELQKEAYFFGKHLFLGWQAAQDLEPYTSSQLPESGKVSLISAPILFHLEHDPSLYEIIKKGSESVDEIDYVTLHKIVRDGPGLEKTKELLNKNILIATTLLYKFPPSDARRALESIILALEH